jgi:hypothetical protein
MTNEQNDIQSIVDERMLDKAFRTKYACRKSYLKNDRGIGYNWMDYR